MTKLRCGYFLRRLALMLAALSLWQVSIPNAAAQTPDDFAHSVAPVLKKHCVPCHGGKQASGSFSVNTRELLVESGHVQPGSATESHLLERILSEDPELQMPPAEKPRLSPAEIATLTAWINAGLQWEPGFSFAPISWEPPLQPRRPELPQASSAERTHPIDRILDRQLLNDGQPIPVGISDAEFLRRVRLDLTGLLPDPQELQEFLQNPSPQRREEKIRQLLDDRIAWADHWMTFFNDLLRNDYSGTGFITGGRTQITSWLYASLLDNKPFDQLTRELIAPSGTEQAGFINGIRWRGEVSAGQTVEIQFAQSVAQAFLGINLKCASCHDSFIDRWTLDEAWGLAAVYSARPLELHRCDKPLGRQAQAAWLFPELGSINAADPPQQRLQQLAALMTHPDNGRFTRTIVNRLWYSLTGRGIVHPLDAMQSPPWNEDLLDYLAVFFSDNGYDLKETLFHIATSQAYQSRTMTRSEEHSPAVGWRGPVSRRLTAEQFLDAVWQLTEAAPPAIDAAVVRVLSDDGQQSLPLQGEWIWGASAAPGSVPPAGEVITLRKTFSLDTAVERAAVLITCDNAATLLVNGVQVWAGTEWSRPGVVEISSQLRAGDNTLVVRAQNAGQGPNAAGLFLQAVLRLETGRQQILVSDDTWEWHETAVEPAQKPLRIPQNGWQKVVVVPPLDVWQQALRTSGQPALNQLFHQSAVMVRASLLKNSALMRALGRPHREQIVSMRPSELSTLEAIVLSNGEQLSAWLQHGATRLQTQAAQDPTQLVSHLSRFSWGRDPEPEELQLLVGFLQSEQGTISERVEDLLWTIVMSPEFLLVR